MGIGRMAIILVIDDYAESLDALANIIRNWGHEVITARNEEDACQYCERQAALDVLIVDVKLRGSRSGVEVARELMAFYPDVGIIFVSGTSLDDLRGEGLLDLHQFPSKRTSFLEKPFTAPKLMRSIEQTLGVRSAK